MGWRNGRRAGDGVGLASTSVTNSPSVKRDGNLTAQKRVGFRFVAIARTSAERLANANQMGMSTMRMSSDEKIALSLIRTDVRDGKCWKEMGIIWVFSRTEIFIVFDRT